MTVAEMEQEMSADEFMRWAIYHGRRVQREQLAMKKK
jgi:hypothetical protein